MVLGSFSGHAGQRGHKADPCSEKWFSWRGNSILTRKVGVLEVVNQREENSMFPNIYIADSPRAKHPAGYKGCTTLRALLLREKVRVFKRHIDMEFRDMV